MKKNYGIKINGVMMFIDKMVVKNHTDEKLGAWKTVMGWNGNAYIFYFDCEYHQLRYSGKSKDGACIFFTLERK